MRRARSGRSKKHAPNAKFAHTLGWPLRRARIGICPLHLRYPTLSSGLMLLIAIFSVIVLLLCWLCYSGDCNS
jgi:hypothetical protein